MLYGPLEEHVPEEYQVFQVLLVSVGKITGIPEMKMLYRLPRVPEVF